MLQLAVLHFQMPQLLSITDLQTAVLRFPAIERLLADFMLAANFHRTEPCFGLLHIVYDSLFCVPAPFQPSSSSASIEDISLVVD